MFKELKAQAKSFLDAKLPFSILEEFSPLDQKYLEEKGSSFVCVNQNIYKYDIKVKQQHIMSLIVAIAFTIILVIIGLFVEDGFIHPVPIILLSISFLAIIRFSVKAKKASTVYLVFNREEGMVTLPCKTKDAKSNTVPFNELVPFWTAAGGATGNLRTGLAAKHKDNKVFGVLVGLDTSYPKLWSFYVWYMDKNRPLPPGTAFDPYRQADFERRKAEGFPKPLYKSFIPTPEATPEQQSEREKYWKDELEEFLRERESVMYDPNIHKNWILVRYVTEEREPISNTYYRYEFENGEIVYMKTDEDGKGFEPPENVKFKKGKMDLFEPWF